MSLNSPLGRFVPHGNASVKHGNAFTLIELLVVITIIIVLVGMAFPAYQGVQDRAKKVQAKNDILQIANATNAYYTEYGQYPCLAQTGSDANDYFAADDST